MEEIEYKSKCWYHRLLSFCCKRGKKGEHFSGRYNVHKRQKQPTIERIRQLKFHNEEENVDPIRIRHSKLEDELSSSTNFRSMFRLALTRLLTTTCRVSSQINGKTFNTSIRHLSSKSEQKLPLGSINDGQALKRMGIQFRCQICDHTLHKTFTRQSYEKGVVIIRCDSCQNLHLIADNLGWFKDLTQDGKFKNVAEMLRAKGETIHRVSVLPTEIDGSVSDNEDQLKTS